MQQPDDKVSLQDGIAALSVCRRVVCKLDEKLPAAARQVNESRAQILAARASVSQRLFRLIDTRARASVSQSEVIALRQIVEQLKTTVKKSSPSSSAAADAQLVEGANFPKDRAVPRSWATDKLRKVLADIRHVDDAAELVKRNTAALKQGHIAARNITDPGTQERAASAAAAPALRKASARLRRRLDESAQGVARLDQSKITKLKVLEEKKALLLAHRSYYAGNR